MKTKHELEQITKEAYALVHRIKERNADLESVLKAEREKLRQYRYFHGELHQDEIEQSRADEGASHD